MISVKKYFVFASLIVSCGPEIQLLPPNEDQYAVCQKAIDCSLLVEQEIRKCVSCIDDFLEDNPQYSAKQIKNSVANAECEVVKEYSETSGIRQCIK